MKLDQKGAVRYGSKFEGVMGTEEQGLSEALHAAKLGYDSLMRQAPAGWMINTWGVSVSLAGLAAAGKLVGETLAEAEPADRGAAWCAHATAALQAFNLAKSEMFAHCCSNPAYCSAGDQIDFTEFNDAGEVISSYLTPPAPSSVARPVA
ncbi:MULTISPECIES: hypothetical protein [Achromobacter]|uniref:hypothetical protein n=1 Tax=Achromobacter TaxID=222 RepID=UPI0023F95837|nr:hypothetical protein [Achromobacter anxifer]MDF8365087.1 hypothetical protein [Achromobacter anxifer]